MRRLILIFTVQIAEISMYIHQNKDWPELTWDLSKLAQLSAETRHRQGRLLGKMESLGFSLQAEAMLQTLTLDVIKSNEIEGEILNPEQVRSSIARRLGMDVSGLVPSDRNVEGVVEMMLDATQRFSVPLTQERLFGWHASLFPAGHSGLYKITAGAWRTGTNGPMQVVSGVMGRERVHFQAPDAAVVGKEMSLFLEWFNTKNDMDPVLKAGIAHVWFVTIHPFDDGNGRIARTIADMQLARSDRSSQRFYSMSAQIRLERNEYYSMLESTQKGTLDITEWLTWFLECLGRAFNETEVTLNAVFKKARFWNTNRSKTFNDRQRLMVNKLLDGFEGKLTSSKWAKIAKCSQDSALRDIQDLIEKEILIKENVGGRSTSYYLFHDLSQI